MSKDTGGPAFPIFPETGGGHAAAFHGMTLRDYFAARAPEPSQHWKVNYARKHGYRGDVELLADWGYEYADALLKARKK